MTAIIISDTYSALQNYTKKGSPSQRALLKKMIATNLKIDLD